MKAISLLLAVMAMPLVGVPSQTTDAPEGAVIASALVSGLDLGRLSPGLREEIAKLSGTPVNRARLNDLAARIEAEQPQRIAAVRAVIDAGGDVQVIFTVARLEDGGRRDNINARYVIESAAIRRVPEKEMTPAIRADLQSLVGLRLESEEAQRLERQVSAALSRYDLHRRILRGSKPGHIAVVYEARRNEASRWLPFQPSTSNVVYHSEQGWGSLLELAINARHLLFSPIIAIDNGDDLIEEYSGFGLRFETRKMGTERLGASLEWSTFDQTWRDATVAALAGNAGAPRLYQTRSTVMPLVSFALTRNLRIRAGVSITELEPLEEAAESEMVNAAVASIGYDRRWTASGSRHDLGATFGLRAGSRALESDSTYNRYLGQADYRLRKGRHLLLVSGMAGGITGDAPLFERFSLGDSVTLRGWNKYDIAPAGGDRMFHTSAEYRFSGFGLFFDAGSVWDEGSERRVRTSTGLGFHPGPVFFTVGFPLNTDDMSAIFTMGIRLGTGARK